MKNSFKDACDNCGKMDYCRGYNGKVLCPECIRKQEEESENKNQEITREQHITDKR